MPSIIKPFAISLRTEKPQIKAIKPHRALQDQDDDLADREAQPTTAVPLQTNNFALKNQDRDPNQSEEQRYRSDLVNRPQAPTSDDYVLQPVEGYGERLLAMMGGGTGRSRLILDSREEFKPLRKVEPWGGFRGIGAEKLDVDTQAELGAWGIGAGARPSGRRRDKRGKPNPVNHPNESAARRSSPSKSDSRRTMGFEGREGHGRFERDRRREEHEEYTRESHEDKRSRREGERRRSEPDRRRHGNGDASDRYDRDGTREERGDRRESRPSHGTSSRVEERRYEPGSGRSDRHRRHSRERSPQRRRERD